MKKDCGNCESQEHKDWQPKNFYKVVNPGRVLIGKKRPNIFCKIQIEDGELSISGVEGPLSNGDARGSCGQINPLKLDLSTLNPGWTVEKLANLTPYGNAAPELYESMVRASTRFVEA